MPDAYDLIVVGAGPGGHAAALHAAAWGARVAVIEKGQWGGTCTNRGCVPTKALLACSREFMNLKKLKRLGISVGEARVDFPAIKRHQRQMVTISGKGVAQSLGDAGVDMKAGEGEIVSPGEVIWAPPEGSKERLTADNIIIAWGSEPLLPRGFQTSDKILTSDGFLGLETLPKSAIIVGAGFIGIEIATFMAELGVSVTIVELLDGLLPLEDREADDLIRHDLIRLGVAIHTSTRMEMIEETGSGVLLTAKEGDKRLELSAECVLMCTGRKPSLRREELVRCGIKYDEKGVAVDERLMTNVAGIYAVGDVTGGVMLAHRAMQQGRAVASHLYGDRTITCRDDTVPSVVYTHPNVARVGLTEKRASELGMKVEIRRVEYGANVMARTELKGNGFVKAVFSDERLIGVTIVGDDAGELIAGMSLAVTNRMGKKELRNWIIPHPSLSEVLHLL
ncbi:MAG TPA: dihydrolipoyl dehydrogenase [Syntrophales bacterium]|nr:dihydrolipoyl dehydrogenase [Syntrophales bacterium]